jgi:hypothetical protein
MQSESSLLCSYEPATGPYPEPDELVHKFPPYFPKIDYNIIFPSTSRPSKWSLRWHFPTKTLYTFLISLVRATCPTNFILIEFIILIMFGEAY